MPHHQLPAAGPAAAHSHSHGHLPQRTLPSGLITWLHDTDLWADYAPSIPNGLSLMALAGLTVALLSVAGVAALSPALALAGAALGGVLMAPATVLGVFAWWRSRHRRNLRAQVLGAIPWRGDEQVLDVGCGTGIMLNGAARRLTTGRAVGIDLWVAHSGGGNLKLLMKNARQEGVADRVEFKEADARQMPFDNATFDVVLSSGALHHISHGREDFDRVIHELGRVLKPGGWLAIWDVAHMIDACASRMPAAGIRAEVQGGGAFLGYDMKILVGQKAMPAER